VKNLDFLNSKKMARRRYFFLNGHLHKMLYIHKGRDIVIAWNFVSGEEVKYLYSDWKRRREVAYTPTEVAAIIGRHRGRLNWYIVAGELPRPARSYSLDGEKRPGHYYYSASEVLDIHEFFCGVARGRPNSEYKENVNTTLTPRSEVVKMLAGGKVLFKVDEKGNMVPVWRTQ
jgi:hypothetical protein